MHGDFVQEGQGVSFHDAVAADAAGDAVEDEVVEGEDCVGECDFLVGVVCWAEFFDEFVFDYVRASGFFFFFKRVVIDVSGERGRLEDGRDTAATLS